MSDDAAFRSHATNTGLIRFLDYEENDFEHVKTLSGGAMNGGIYLVRRRSDGLLCIKKTLQPEQFAPEGKSVPRGYAYEGSGDSEATMLARIRAYKNPNLNSIAAYIRPPLGGQKILYVRYCDLGSLDELIIAHRSSRTRIPEEFLWHIFRSVANALSTIHWGTSEALNRRRDGTGQFNYMIHYDVKPDNIFLSAWPGHTYPLVVLGDFGCAGTRHMLHTQQRQYGNTGAIRASRPYLPPESEHFFSSRGNDVFALGVSMMMMMEVWDINRGALRSEEQLDRLDNCGYSKYLCRIVRKTCNLVQADRILSEQLVLEIENGRAQAVREGLIANTGPALSDAFSQEFTHRQPDNILRNRKSTTSATTGNNGQASSSRSGSTSTRAAEAAVGRQTSSSTSPGQSLPSRPRPVAQPSMPLQRLASPGQTAGSSAVQGTSQQRAGSARGGSLRRGGTALATIPEASTSMALRSVKCPARLSFCH